MVMSDEPDASTTDTGRRDTGNARPQADTGLSQRHREDMSMFANGAQTFADMTGGSFYRIVGTPDPFFGRVAAAASAVYRLAVEPPADTTPGRDFALAATVRRPGLSAHANRHAIAPSGAAAAAVPVAPAAAPKPAPPMPLDEQLRAAIATGQARSGVPITLSRAVRRARDAAQVDVGVRIEIPSTVKGPLTALFGIVDDGGAIRSGRKVIDAPSQGENYRLAFTVPVAPGRYRLRFVVADATGAIGSVESVVQAQLAAMGPFTVSDLLTSSVDAKGEEETPPSPEDLPASAKTLNASLELYPVEGAAPPADVLVKLTLVAAGQPQPDIERIVTPENVDGVLHADAEFPVERLAPGTYAIRQPCDRCERSRNEVRDDQKGPLILSIPSARASCSSAHAARGVDGHRSCRGTALARQAVAHAARIRRNCARTCSAQTSCSVKLPPRRARTIRGRPPPSRQDWRSRTERALHRSSTSSALEASAATSFSYRPACC
jgi:hypothetical protein